MEVVEVSLGEDAEKTRTDVVSLGFRLLPVTT